MKIANLKQGQKLYCLTRHKMGNTKVRTTSVHPVIIIEVAPDRGSFIASWNGNRAEKYFSIPPHWKANKPYMVDGFIGSSRLATKEERAKGKFTETQDRFVLREPTAAENGGRGK